MSGVSEMKKEMNNGVKNEVKRQEKRKSDEMLDEELLFDSEEIERMKGLSAVEREKIIFERHNRINDIRERKQLLELEKKRDEENVKKRKNSEYESNDINTNTYNSNLIDSKLLSEMSSKPFILTRDILMKNAFKPYIQQLRGCFVRIIRNGEYLAGKITRVRTGDAYMMPDKLKADVWFDLDFGDKIIPGWSIAQISSSKMEEEEFAQFLRTFKITNMDSIFARYEKVLAEFKRQVSDIEFDKIMANKHRANPPVVPTVKQKILLIRKRDAAIEAKNKDLAMKYQLQLEAIEDAQMDKKRREVEKEYEESRRRENRNRR